MPAWTTDLTGANWTAANSWSDATNFRSYWAKSTNYGKEIGAAYRYPATYGQPVNGALHPYNQFDDIAQTINTTNRTAQSAKSPLAYTNWNSLTGTLGGVGYCMENTNTEAILKQDQIFYSKVTHVLLKAQAVDAQGAPLTLVRYYGNLYTEQGFWDMLLDGLKHYAYSGANFESIKLEDLEAVENYDGKVQIVLSPAGKAKTWYTGKDASAAISTQDLETRFQDLEMIADWYTNGMMYYCIPIEHLRGGKVTFNQPTTGSTATFVPYDVQEADYGIVRNHLYDITINKIENLGTAVHDADELIIPNTRANSMSYYVGSRVNILAWKIVQQNVEL